MSTAAGSLARAGLRAVGSALLALPGQAQAPELFQRFDPLQDVGIDQRIGERVPLDLAFRDHEGRDIRLEELFGDQPVLLALVYYECPMLCTLVLNGVMAALRTLPLRPGQDFQLLVVSIDPDEQPEMAAAKRLSYLRAMEVEGEGEGWHFLLGDQGAIDALTRAVGFRYVYDEPTDEFAHASGLQILTPDGRLSRYLYGIEYSARDLRLGLVEASEGRLGSVVDQVLLLCLSYDPTTGRYGLAILTSLRIGGVLVVVLLATFILTMLRRERRARRFPERAHVS